MKREIKFRSWNPLMKRMSYNDDVHRAGLQYSHRLSSFAVLNLVDGEDCEEFLMQYTGLKDKNGGNTCIYEEDIISLSGILIGNKYENENLLKDKTNLLIEGFGTENWRATEEKAMDRGCFYSK